MPKDVELPSFTSPPVGEVVIGIQFEQLHGLDARHIGKVAEAFSGRLPSFAAHPLLDPQIERFDRLPAGIPFGFSMVEPPVFPRLWFMRGDGSELVQIQRDRLMHNWRRMAPQAAYPRYPQLREQFIEDWQTLSRVVAEIDGSQLRTTQCEVMYLNLIDPQAPGMGSCPYPANIFSFLSESPLTCADAKFESTSYTRTSIVNSADTSAPERGRFYIEMGTGLNADTGRRMFNLNLTVRGAPRDEGLEGALKFSDFAHEIIVRSFAELTTEDMHTKWGRTS
jgi:uncharacterized protein (TIGR04255 family)